MTRFTIKSLVLALAMSATGTAAIAAPVLFEEKFAREEEQRIYTNPIAGIQNRFWFDYRIDVIEAQKELASDLQRASDIEDLRDAWEEYGVELRKERVHYAKEMAERGYREGVVIIED